MCQTFPITFLTFPVCFSCHGGFSSIAVIIPEEGLSLSLTRSLDPVFTATAWKQLASNLVAKYLANDFHPRQVNFHNFSL